MNSLKRVISIALAVMMVVTCSIISVNAATTSVEESSAGSGITIHYYPLL